MKSNICKNIYVILFVLFISISSFANAPKNQEYRDNVLLEAKIIDDLTNLDQPIKRYEFAKIIVKASPQKDLGEDYIKIATDNKYMIRNIYGDFQEENLTSYNDLIRACLALLSYTDKDFVGNKVNARIEKFIELELNKNIEKDVSMMITKHDIINAIYNTLKEEKNGSSEMYYKSVFTDMILDDDSELNISKMLKTKIDGPYFLKRSDVYNNTFDVPFDMDTSKCLINGRPYKNAELRDDIDNYSYAVCYYDKDSDTIYAYTERSDAALTVAAMSGYIDEINYNANDFLVPYTVDIGLNRYKIASDELQFAFSYAGHIKKGDKVCIVYNKINDIENLREALGEDKDEGRIVKGSLITAFKME